MAVYTKRKVVDLIINQDNELDLGTLSPVVKIFTNCPDTYVEKEVTGGKITLTAEDIDFLNTGQINFADDYGITTTDYYINNSLNNCTDINAANISKLYAKVSGGGSSEGKINIMTQEEYDQLGTYENKLYYITEE